MCADLVVYLPPFFHDIPGMVQVHKPVLVQTSVTELPDKALGISVSKYFVGGVSCRYVPSICYYDGVFAACCKSCGRLNILN